MNDANYADALVTGGPTSLSAIPITKVLDITNTIYDSTTVNYANVYLYGTDGTLAHDDIAKEVIDPQQLEIGVLSASVPGVLDTTYQTTSDGSSGILTGGEYQEFDNGDRIHYSDVYSNHTGMGMFDGQTGWANTWYSQTVLSAYAA